MGRGIYFQAPGPGPRAPSYSIGSVALPRVPGPGETSVGRLPVVPPGGSGGGVNPEVPPLAEGGREAPPPIGLRSSGVYGLAIIGSNVDEELQPLRSRFGSRLPRREQELPLRSCGR